MNANTINADLLSRMFLAGAKNLEVKKEWINELNVFPVPDGDTGTNMTMTIMSAAKEVSSLVTTNDVSMEALCKAISSGSLRGARGNSGVILSQLLRGLTKVAKEYNELTVPVLSEAFDKAVETAYKAVLKPKEGTILTVAKGIANKGKELNNLTDMNEFLSSVIAYGEEVLSKTPDMLPVLKQAGVVDSGGQGLIEVLHGAYDAYLGKEINLTEFSAPSSSKPMAIDKQAEEDIKFGYCTEFIIMLDKVFNIKHELDFKEYLESIGDSIVLVADDDIVKVHVHTNDPGLAIQRALKFGALSNMKIDNMRLEHQEKLFKQAEMENAGKAAVKEPAKDYGFVSVCAGDGLFEIFKQLGVDEVISGGQTMNPSTDDIVSAIEKVNAKTVFILPNNKNIIMAANQAEYLVSDKKVIVIPTKTVPQGICAMINFIADDNSDVVKDAMMNAVSMVETGQITYAVRDTMIDDMQIHEGDFMGIGDKGLLSVDKDIYNAAYAMLDKMITDSTELVSVYYGEEVNEDEANKISDYVSEKYPSVDVEVSYGGQPVYYYIISCE